MPNGMKSRPMPANSRNRRRYICLADVTSSPHARRRASRSGADPRQDVREAARSRRANTAATVSAPGNGLRTICVSTFEPAATAPQKNSVARGPIDAPPGTAKLRFRQLVGHVIGSVHWNFMFGPVGPLKNAGRSSPQRPWKPSHGYSAR